MAGGVFAAAPAYPEVYLGVRPENVGVLDEPDGTSLPAEVYVSEALGNETLVRRQVSGQELVARADASYEPDVGARVWVRPDLRRAPCSTPGTKRASYDPLGEVSA